MFNRKKKERDAGDAVMAKGPAKVDIALLADGSVSLAFDRDLRIFNAPADDMATLGMNLIKAAGAASVMKR